MSVLEHILLWSLRPIPVRHKVVAGLSSISEKTLGQRSVWILEPADMLVDQNDPLLCLTQTKK